ncbi:hypothetical protein H5U35_10620 [Candidatus Aerophobetes bacterium]|nr:hypothetical protein [Candidatus Aerophobetes bacterium]
MKKTTKLLIAIIAFSVFMVFFKISSHTLKIFSTAGKTFKEAISSGKNLSSGGFDVITSASIRVEDNSSLTRRDT